MKIIILGSGQVGSTLAENLISDNNDVTVVDNDEACLLELQDHLDLRVVHGIASHPNVLLDAGAEDADMLIAVTSSDEVNMIACQVAHTLFQTPLKIARLRAPSYHYESELFQANAVPIDVLISPEQLVTDYVRRLIEYPGSLQVLDFANGTVQLVAMKAYYGDQLAGKTLVELRDEMPDLDMRIAAIFRGNQSVPLDGETVVEIGDEVFLVAAKNNILKIMANLHRLENPSRRITIAGGGNIGFRLASSLENDYQIKVIEHNVERAQFIASELSNSTVLRGDASDKELLISENIEHTDIFCALTNDDEINIMSCLQAKRLGAKQVMALIKRTAYADLIDSSEIDVAISPQMATIGSILSHTRQGDLVKIHSLHRGAAEAIEAVAHGDIETSKVVGRSVGEIKFPSDTNIGAIVRGEEVLMPHKDTVIEAEDHVILFLSNKKSISQIERLFQVNVSFFS